MDQLEFTLLPEHWEDAESLRGKGNVSDTCPMALAIKDAYPGCRPCVGIYDVAIDCSDNCIKFFLLDEEASEIVHIFDKQRPMPANLPRTFRFARKPQI